MQIYFNLENKNDEDIGAMVKCETIILTNHVYISIVLTMTVLNISVTKFTKTSACILKMFRYSMKNG